MVWLKRHKHKNMILDAIVVVAVDAIFIVGSASFYVFYEGWTFLDSMILVMTTITTTGFGYSAPTDDYSRLFTIFVMLFGILYVLSSLVSGMNFVLQNLQRKIKATKVLQSFFFSVALFVMVNVFGSLFLCFYEGTSFITGLYFALETSTVSL